MRLIPILIEKALKLIMKAKCLVPIFYRVADDFYYGKYFCIHHSSWGKNMFFFVACAALSQCTHNIVFRDFCCYFSQITVYQYLDSLTITLCTIHNVYFWLHSIPGLGPHIGAFSSRLQFTTHCHCTPVTTFTYCLTL